MRFEGNKLNSAGATWRPGGMFPAPPTLSRLFGKSVNSIQTSGCKGGTYIMTTSLKHAPLPGISDHATALQCICQNLVGTIPPTFHVLIRSDGPVASLLALPLPTPESCNLFSLVLYKRVRYIGKSRCIF